MNIATDLDQRLSATLRAKAGQVRSASWPTAEDLVPSRLPVGGAPSHHGRRVWAAVAAVAVLALIAAGLAARDGSRDRTGVRAGDEAADALAQIERIADSGTIFDQVGTGTAGPEPREVSGPVLTDGGRPEVLYVGAEYCPYCAAERWALVVALSRFGRFSSLGATTSASDDVNPDTPSFTFRDSTYSSGVLSFTGVELQDRDRQPLMSLTPDQTAIEKRLDADGSIPFIDFGGQFVLTGANLDIGVLEGRSMDEIADALGDPSSPVSQAVVGAANQITNAICHVTGGTPASVCTMVSTSTTPTSGG